MIPLLIPLLLAQGGFPIIYWIGVAIIVIGAVAILFAVAKAFGYTPHPVLIFIFTVVLVVIVALIALKIIGGLL